MEGVFGDSLSTTNLIFLLLALGLAFAFEFVNGFHDTANAVATVIYTNSLKPVYAVVWSGMWNLIGVLTSMGTVAFGILALLPVELVLNIGSGAGFAMVFSLLISAIIWNVGTWYLGLPASSSHTLIGSIVGVGIANSVLNGSHSFGDGINLPKLQDTIVALLVSPLIGFAFSALLLVVAKLIIKYPPLFQAPPDKTTPPPWPVRALLILTCTGVSYEHGSNDGQKGMGLVLLILIGVVPSVYALDLSLSPANYSAIVTQSATVATALHTVNAGAPMPAPSEAESELSRFAKSGSKAEPATVPALEVVNGEIGAMLHGKSALADVPKADRTTLRSEIYLVSSAAGKLSKGATIADDTTKKALSDYKSALDKSTTFIPTWVKFAVAICLGLGTMIGWKRIVVTVGEKIGKEHLTYAQGASAEIVTYATIRFATQLGLPVSTTHILSSGIAGTMAANGSGLQRSTIRNIILAWVLTLPVCIFLGSMLFAFGLRIVASLGMHRGPKGASARATKSRPSTFLGTRPGASSVFLPIASQGVAIR